MYARSMKYKAVIVRLQWDGNGRAHGFLTDLQTGERHTFQSESELLALLKASGASDVRNGVQSPDRWVPE